MLKAIWLQRAQARLEEYSEPSEFDRVFRNAQLMFRAFGSKPDYHILIHFNDCTAYVLCERYNSRFRVAANAELKRCTFVSVPEDTNTKFVDTVICEACHGILINETNAGDCATVWRSVCDNELRKP